MSDEKLKDGLLDGEKIIINCRHCGGETFCKRGEIGLFTLYLRSCISCLAKAGVSGVKVVICSVCEGKGKIAL